MALDRRDFVKLVVGGVVGTLASPLPWKLTDDLSIWTQNWGWIPRLPKGKITYANTTSKLCPSSCGLKIAMVNGQPFRAEGDPKSPLSLGGISSLAVSEVQLHYSPSRAKGPLKRTDKGSYQSISWDDALKLVAEKLGPQKGKAGTVAIISGEETGTANEVLSAFLTALGNNDFYMMPGDVQAASRAWNEIMGAKGQPGYDLEHSDFVLALDADIFDSWGPSVRNAKAFNATHPIGGEASATYVFVGPYKCKTATVCERSIMIKAGSEATFAFGLAASLIRQGAKTGAADLGEFKNFLASAFPANRVEEETGVPAQVIDALAADLAKAKAPVVIPGSGFGQGAGATGFIAGMALNVLLDRIGKPGGVTVLPEAPTVVNGALSRSQAYKKDLVQYLLGIDAGKVQTPEVLMIYEANPAYTLPQSEAIARALKKIPFTVTFSPFLDETAAMTSLVLPTAMPLERFDDVYTPYGLGSVFYTQNKPVMKPVADGRATPDVVLALAKSLGADLGFASFKDVLAAKSGKVAGLAAGTAGGVNLGVKFLSGAVKTENPAKDLPLGLTPVADLLTGTGFTGIPPHNVSAIRNTTLLDGMLFVHMNSVTAKKLNVKEGDKVKVSGTQGEIKALVHVYESMAVDTVSVPLGLGHTAWDQYNDGKGDNISKILTVGTEPGTGLSVWTGSRVKVAKI